MIKLRFLNIEHIGPSLLLDAINPQESREIKLRAVRRLGIEPRANESPLHAWLRHLSELNGKPFQLPVDSDLSDAIASDAGARRFLWWLA